MFSAKIKNKRESSMLDGFRRFGFLRQIDQHLISYWNIRKNL